MSPPSSPDARPIDASERLVLLDVLRGFALCGVFLSNTFFWFSGRAYLPREQNAAALSTAPLWDVGVTHLTTALVSGKFVTLFSFLFGLGFWVQLSRAEARGASVVPLYLRRLGVMLLLGVTHLLLLWHGDILSAYALLGTTLLLFRERSERTLLVWTALLLFLLPVVIREWLMPLLGSPGSGSTAEAARVAEQHTAQARAQMLEALTRGTWPDVVRANAAFYFGSFIRNVPVFMVPLLGRFLLGLLAGRRRLFHEASRHLPFFRKLLLGGVLVGLPASLSSAWYQYLVTQKTVDPQASWSWLLLPLRQLGDLGLAATYASGLVLLFQREAGRRVLHVLAPVGRMALTNYLTESLVSIWLYDGFGLGLLGKVSPSGVVGLTLALFAVQIAFSHAWLARFRFGPAEWVWRSLTYGRAQPMRLQEPLPTLSR